MTAALKLHEKLVLASEACMMTHERGRMCLICAEHTCKMIIAEAVAEEREACAAVADDDMKSTERQLQNTVGLPVSTVPRWESARATAKMIAKNIRARGSR